MGTNSLLLRITLKHYERGLRFRTEDAQPQKEDQPQTEAHPKIGRGIETEEMRPSETKFLAVKNRIHRLEEGEVADSPEDNKSKGEPQLDEGSTFIIPTQICQLRPR